MCYVTLLSHIGADVPSVPHGADPEEHSLLQTEVTQDEHDDPALDLDGEDEDQGRPQRADASAQPWFDNSDDELDDTAMVEDTIGAAPQDPPSGFKYADDQPPLETEDDLKALVGQYILHAWDAPDFAGWFIGRISAVGCSPRDLRATPSANVVVTYDKKHTKQKHLHGRVASTLTADKYGPREWWVLLQPDVE